MIDKLFKEKIKEYLNDDIEILVFDELDSTNSYLKSHIGEASPEFLTVIADSQTLGKGRMSRKFHSPKESGIYISILLKPQIKAENSVLITAAAAVAVNRAIEDLSGKTAKIKWVNDIYIKNKKVCGILTEGSINPNGSLNYVILGIGINAYTPENNFDDEIKDIAGAVFEKRKENLRNKLIAKVIKNFKEYYNALEDKNFLEYYKKKNLVLGKEITVPKNNICLSAKALDIDENCRLLVEYKNGEKEYLSSGEISIGVDFFE